MPEDTANLETPYALDWRARRHGFSDSHTGTNRCTLCGQHKDAMVHEPKPEMPDVAGAVRIMERGMGLLAILFVLLTGFVIWRQINLRYSVNDAINAYISDQRDATCANIRTYPRNPATAELLERVYEQNKCPGTLTNPTGPPVSPKPTPSSALGPVSTPTTVVVIVPGATGPAGPVVPPGPVVVTVSAAPPATAPPPRASTTPVPSPTPRPTPSPTGTCRVSVLGIRVCTP